VLKVIYLRLKAFMNTKALIKKLKNAAVCCTDCGQRWGEYKGGCSSWWKGTCRVCDKETAVTETRDFKYLRAGIAKLSESILNKTQVKTGANDVN